MLEYRQEPTIYAFWVQHRTRWKLCLLSSWTSSYLWILTLFSGLVFYDFSCYAKGRLFTPVRIQSQGGCGRQKSLGRGLKCSSKCREPGGKQMAGSKSVWGECIPEQSGLQVLPSLHCHMDGFKAEPVPIATAPARAASPQDAAPGKVKSKADRPR